MTKVDIKKINKSIDEYTSSRFSHEGTVEEGKSNLELYQADFNTYSYELKSKEADLKVSLRDLRQLNRELKHLNEQDKTIRDNFENRILIEP